MNAALIKSLREAAVFYGADRPVEPHPVRSMAGLGREEANALSGRFDQAADEIERLNSLLAGMICEDCPPADYPTDVTRCTPCPRRAKTSGAA